MASFFVKLTGRLGGLRERRTGRRLRGRRTGRRLEIFTLRFEW